MKLRTILYGCLIATAGNLQAEEHIEWVGANSGVNWTAAQATAEGAGVGPADKPGSIATLMACRAAVVDAQRNLLESMQGVRINSTTVVNDMMLQSDVIKTTVEGVLQGATIVSREPADDGTCRVAMTAPLAGKMSKAVYGQMMAAASYESSPLRDWGISLISATLDWLVEVAYAGEEPGPPWQAAVDGLADRLEALEELLTTHPGVVDIKDSGPTGLVLDARGSNFIPSMSPKIRKVKSGVMFPTEAHQANARDRGQLVSLFTRDLSTARRHPIVGERPVVLKALRTFGDTRTEIVLGTAAAERLEGLVASGFLNDAGVIIVL